MMWIVPAIVLGYGMLVKGPFIFIFFYGVVVEVMWYSNRLKELLRIEHIAGIFVFSLISLWWFYLASLQAPPMVIMEKMSSQLLIRFIQQIDWDGWAENILKAFVNLLPWLLIAPILWDKKLFAVMTPDEQTLFRGCRTGTIAVFVIINFMPGTSARYSLPVVTTFCLLMGWMLSLHKEWLATDRLWKNILLICLPVSCLSAVAGLIFVSRLPGSFAALGFAVCATAVVYRMRNKIKNTTALSLVTAVVVAAGTLQYSTFGLDIFRSVERRRPAATAINNIVGADQTLYIFKPGTFLNPVLFRLRPTQVFIYDVNDISKNVHYMLVKRQDLEAGQMQNHISGRSPEVLYEANERLTGDYRLVRLQ
jgi:4-amino-4-deoxy-L-arabinose transferase-like glycosyltransferase